MTEITITLPAIDEAAIATIETLTTEAAATEAEAIKALREKYATLARQNGYVRIGWSYRGDGSNWEQTEDYYYERDGKRMKALRCIDNFNNVNTTQNSGRRAGDRLYLLATGEWLRIEQDGNWSRWQGASESWACGEGILPDDDNNFDETRNAGSIRIVTDAEVASEYSLADVVKGLGNALKALSQKLPERMAKVQQRAQLAAQLLSSLGRQ